MVTLRATAVFIFVSFLSFAFVDQVDAQHRPIHRAGRFLGIGWGNGYHTKTPGPASRYYTPYSLHNSNLRSHNTYVAPHRWQQYPTYTAPAQPYSHSPPHTRSQVPSYDNSFQVAPGNRFQPPSKTNRQNQTPTPALKTDLRPKDQSSLRDNIDSLDLDDDSFEIPGAFLPATKDKK